MKRVVLAIRMAWYAPMLVGLVSGRARRVIALDVDRWVTVVVPPVGRRRATLALLATYREYRTLYCYRLRRAGFAPAALATILALIYPGERTLFLACGDIGPGLFIQHGFATIIAARRLGSNCWVNQQVTIGDGARIGANAVVLHDVAAGCTAVGVPARILPPKRERGAGA